MNNHDDAVRECRSYEVAFQVGLVGSIILVFFALLGDTLAWLVALVIWSAVTVFVLPRLYIVYCDKVPHFPRWSVQGPHQ